MAEGPNELIRTSRAALVTSAAHVFEDLAPALAWPPSTPAAAGEMRPTDDEGAVLRALDDVPLAADHLAGALGLVPGRLAVLLSLLEVKGWAVRTPGGYTLTTAGARTLRE